MRWPIRFSLVPWLGAQDLEPMGIPEATLRRQTSTAHVLRIPTPLDTTDWLMTITDDSAAKTLTAALIRGTINEPNH